MKKNTIIVSLISVFLVVVAVIAGFSAVETYMTKHTTNDKYTYENQKNAKPKMDSGFVIDGVLDEKEYSEVKPLVLNKKFSDEIGTISFSCYMGEYGFYIGAEVFDSVGAYYHSERNSASNSGVEFYLAPADAESMNEAYEIDMTAGGDLNFKQRLALAYTTKRLPFDEAPIYEVKRYGKLNTGECKNYTCELFIPYGAVEMKEKPEEVLLAPCLISQYSENVEDGGTTRNYYNFATEQISYGSHYWSVPTLMYHFDTEGIIAYDIGVNVEGEGKVSEENDETFVPMYDDVTFVVEPESDTRITSFKVNGIEKIYELETDSNGKTTYTCEFVQGDIQIDAVFDYYEDNREMVTGTIQCAGVTDYSDFTVRFYGMGKNYIGTMDAATGKYSVNAPVGTYWLEIASVEGKYVILKKDMTVKAGLELPTIAITSSQYGANRYLTLKNANRVRGTEVLYEGTLAGKNFVYTGFMGSAKKITEERYVTNTSFQYTTGEKNNSLTLQFVVWDGGWSVKLVDGSKNTKNYNLSNDERSFAKRRNGVGVALEKEGNLVNLYLETEDGNFKKVISDFKIKNVPQGSETTLSKISFNGAEGCSFEQPAILRAAKFYHGETEHTACSKRTVYDVMKNDNLVLVDGLEDGVDGGYIDFTVAAKEKNIFTAVKVNDTQVKKVSGNYRMPTLLYNKLDIYSMRQQKISATIVTNEKIDADGLKLTFKPTRGSSLSRTVSGKQVTLRSIPNGTCDVYARIYGQDVYVDTLVLETDGNYDLDLTKAFVNSVSLEKGQVTYDFDKGTVGVTGTCNNDGRTLYTNVNLEGEFSVSGKYKLNADAVDYVIKNDGEIRFGLLFWDENNRESGVDINVTKSGIKVQGITVTSGSNRDWAALSPFGTVKDGAWTKDSKGFADALMNDGVYFKFTRTASGSIEFYMGTTRSSMEHIGSLIKSSTVPYTETVTRIGARFCNTKKTQNGYKAVLEGVTIETP